MPRSRLLGLVVACLSAGMPSPVRSAEVPAAIRWDFGVEETTPLAPHGDVHRDIPGPRPPDYPDFDAGNTAVKFDGQGAHFSFVDPGPQSVLDFTNGDALTLEAWVQVDELHSGENAYVIGKGRTGEGGVVRDNQNWSLRLAGKGGMACVNFLFATPSADEADSHWHRWTTKKGFKPGKGWHHIAVSYRFGDPKSIRGWIDGKPQPGGWDMGGETSRPPVVDDDEVWIGSSMRGSAANSFRGSIDAVAVHRRVLDDTTLKARYKRQGGEAETVVRPAPAVMPELGPLPPGRVAVVLHEAYPEHTRWLNEGEAVPAETLRGEIDLFLLDRIPLRFDALGIREGWKAPVLARIAADVRLEPGTRRFLVRARGLTRLWIDGKLVSATPRPILGSPNGEESMVPVATPPLPGLRPAEHLQQEVFGDLEVQGDGPHRMVLETVIGGRAFRPDPGELCVAVRTPDGKSFELVEPAGASPLHVPLTDAGVIAALERIEGQLHAQDDTRRRGLAASQDAYWSRRHADARTTARPAPEPPKAGHPIDAFLQAKVDRAVAESSKTPLAEARKFHDRVLPILRDQCFRCHGDKDKGGLRLNSRAAVLKGGNSESPAVAPGNLDESELIARVRSTEADERMPPGGSPLSNEQIKTLEEWVKSGAVWPAPPIEPAEVAPPPLVDDASFLRRVTLDTIGLPPTEGEVRAFLADTALDKRQHAVDRLLADERWADHWISYWQDALAENPTLINSSLNTTGPFRWFLLDALRDNKAFDRLVTELILLRGGAHDGGSAGFGIAGDNQAPLASKAQIITNAFLGMELQCARCHDSPYHSTKQEDLYGLAAMLERKPAAVPKSSRVPAAFFEKKTREPLIKVTLDLSKPVAPRWPFAEVTGSADDATLNPLLSDPKDTRERLAALVTSPRNGRFAEVLVNRVWRRLMGAGFVEPAHDWEGRALSHPDLLAWLAHEFVTHDYDVKHVARLILTSQTYQRAAVGRNLTASADLRFFVAPERRRLSAEQVVDSLFAASGQDVDVEELTFDPDARRPSNNRLTLGYPKRAWMFANLANERDRPSLNLPRARAVVDMLSAFGWNGARQSPQIDRETSPNVQQPGVLENGVAAVWLTTAAVGSGLAEAAVAAKSPADLVDALYLRVLGRFPTDTERGSLVQALTPGFEGRLTPLEEIRLPEPLPRLPRITWSNHLSPQANSVAIELEKRSRLKPPADPRLRDDWRESYEDVVWSILNIREFVWMP